MNSKVLASGIVTVNRWYPVAYRGYPQREIFNFSLEQHGYIGILEAGDMSLQAIGLPASLEQIMPEWVSRLPLEDELYYILYVMADNDCVIQVYLPKTLVAGAL